jgi:hypothetical protein
MAKYTKQEVEESRKSLLEDLKPGDTVYTKVNHVSRSGMLRHIEVYIFKDNQPLYLSYDAARVLGWGEAKDGGVNVTGCGMDMGFHLVYSLSYRLFPNGFGIPCSKCDYRPVSREGVTTPEGCLDRGEVEHDFHGRNGDRSGWDNDGGYALKQRWL